MPSDETLVPAATLGGRLLGAVTRAAGAVRPAAKPLHPRGGTYDATLVRHGGSGTGAAWLDEPGTHAALVRRSRAAGLPHPLPDVHGLAVRVHLDDDRVADLLLATTGHRGPLRFLLRPGWRPDELFFGSLLPYRSPTGPVVLGARHRGGGTWELQSATGLGGWSSYGTLTLGPERPDQPVSFDAVLNSPPGLEQYAAVARLRLPSYRAARRSRHEVRP